MTNKSIDTPVDAISMGIFMNRLLSIVEEMGHVLIRASFSTNIKERKDCSVAMFDRQGRLIAQASHVPLHLGSLSGSVRTVLDHYGPEGISEGDCFICNDSYLAGGTHAPDINFVTPIFVDGKLSFFAANCGHHSDVGGSVPGSTSHSAKTVFEEGIRLPIMRIRRKGELDSDLLEMIAHNTREYEERLLDLNVQIATNDRGAQLMHSLVLQLGLSRVESSIEDLLTYTEARLRQRIAELGEVSGSFTTWLDDDGFEGDQVPVQANVRAEGGRLTVDFEGSGPQSRGSFNVPRSALQASVYYAVKTMIDPELMPNEGMFGAHRHLGPRGQHRQSGLSRRGRFAREHGPEGGRRGRRCLQPVRCRRPAHGLGQRRDDHHRPVRPGPARWPDLRLYRNHRRRCRRAFGPGRNGRRACPRHEHVEPSRRGAGDRVSAAGRGIRPGSRHRRRRAPAGRPWHHPPHPVAR